METSRTVNNKPAYLIYAKEIYRTEKAVRFNCEGDFVWLPKGSFHIVSFETILIQVKMYKEKFE